MRRYHPLAPDTIAIVLAFEGEGGVWSFPSRRYMAARHDGKNGYEAVEKACNAVA